MISAQLVEVRVCRSEFRAHGRRAEPVECGQLRDEPCPRALRICGQNGTYDGRPLMAAKVTMTSARDHQGSLDGLWQALFRRL